MNKVWEIIEREAKEGASRGYKGSGYRGNMRGGMREDGESSYRGGRKEHDVQEAYEYGFDEGYSEAMKKIFDIIRNAD